MKFYLGIDGGGTRTTASVCDEKGTLVCKVTGKTINFYSIGMRNARKNLSEIMSDVYKNIGEVTFENAFIGCSALDNRADSDTTNALCSDIIISKNITMDSDTYVALFSGDCSVSRAVVICGTGSMATGIDEKIHTKSGWGHVIGDGGSAYSIAVNGLSEAVNLFDENKSDSPLVKAAQHFFKTDNLRNIIDVVYNENTTKDVIAGFAKCVSGEAENGDEISLDILKGECNKLLRTVYSLIDQMNSCDILYLYGGVFQNSTLFRELFTESFNEKFPGIKAELLSLPPDEGALKLAREQYE
ncbi:MAG: hypothetical protein J6D06_09330 [Clostridia bacterium]|nr:hypothetical protein [Clostridia bacterium]